MADTPPTGPNNDIPAAGAEPPRRALPRAARLSRLAGSSGEPGATAPEVTAPLVGTPPLPPAAPVGSPPLPSAAPVGETVPAATVSSEPISGGVQMVELVATAASTPSPAVVAAKQAAERAATRTSAPVMFKPLQDSLATRSAIFSGIGLLLCFFPVLSLVGFFMGLVARRRIRRSGGQLLGAGSALLGILLGAAGVVVGTTADIVFLLRR